jgi:Flp pilus assembly protein TadG
MSSFFVKCAYIHITLALAYLCLFKQVHVCDLTMSKVGKRQESHLDRSGWFCFSRFSRNSSGASAIEFALVTAPLLLLLLGLLGVGLIYLANATLENAVAQGARLIRTGEAQGQSFDAGRFKTEVCKHLTAPVSCAGLRLDIRTFSSFGGSDLTNPLDSSGNLKSEFSYAPGVGGQVVIVRAFYEWDLPARRPIDELCKILGAPEGCSLGTMQNGNRLLIATLAFRNEPFK